MKTKSIFQTIAICFSLVTIVSCSPKMKKRTITDAVMQEVYNEIKTPFKYGLVMVPEDNSYKMDCPSIFKKK